MSGETVAQSVRSHLDLDPRLLEMLLNDARHAPRGDFLPAVVEEHGNFTLAGKIPFLALFLRVITQSLQCHVANRHDSLLRAFADDANDAQLKVDVGPFETNKLAHAHAGRIKNLQHSAITHVKISLDFDTAEQLKHIVYR